jgi:hypothetical protein
VIREAIGDMQSYRQIAAAAREDVCRKFVWTGQKESILAALGL